MTSADVHGPIDFVLLEFTADRLTGEAAQALLDLVDKGIVTLYDVMVVGKDDDGSVYARRSGRERGAGRRLRGPLRGPVRSADRGGHARSGRHDAAGHPRRADRLREHVGGAVRRRGQGRGRRADRRRTDPGPGRHGRAGRPGQHRTAEAPESRQPVASTPSEADMPGLLRGIARTAVVAGTASAVGGRVRHRQDQKWAPRQDAAAQAAPAYQQPVYQQPQQVPAQLRRRPRTGWSSSSSSAS